MSVQTKKSSSRSGGSRSAKNKRVPVPETVNETVYQEVILWVMLAVSIVLFLSNFGIGGKVGNALSGVLFGIFGLLAYIFPILLFVGTVFVLSNGTNKIAIIKIVAAVLFVCFLCLFLELVSGIAAGYSPARSFQNGMSERSGGGFLGGLLTWMICPNLGRVSAYVIDLVVLIITMVIVTERSAWKHVQKSGKRVYESAREGNERLRMRQEQHREEQKQHREERREEQELRRMERKVTGVSVDTKLTAETDTYTVSDALTEITPESFSQLAQKKRPMPVPEAKPSVRLFTPSASPVAAAEKIEPAIKTVGKTEQKTSKTNIEPRLQPLSFAADIQKMPELSVTQQRQVSLQPLQPQEEAADTENAAELVQPAHEQRTEMPVFSPELQRLFAQPEEPAAQELEAVEAEQAVLEQAEQTKLEAVSASVMQQLAAEEPELAEFLTEPEPRGILELAPMPEERPKALEPIVVEEVPVQPIQPEEPVQVQRAARAQEPIVREAVRESGNVQQPVLQNPQAETTEEEAQEIAEEIAQQEQETKRVYTFPPVELLKKGDAAQKGDSKQYLQETALKLQQTLKNFGVNVTILNVSCGPTVTRYEIQPEMGVKVSKIVNLTDDIKLNLAAADIRMEAPIPGKAAIGIEVPNKETMPVMFRDLVESKEFQEHPSKLAFAAGRDIGGDVIMGDIAKMPHLLIAGATGSGKSVCINTIIMSLLYRADPEDVKLILIDPKVVELSVYNGIPHLFIPVVTDPKKAAGALNWAVAEMDSRYQKFAACGARKLEEYNAKVAQLADIEDKEKPKKLPQIVIIVDELADLMMVAPGEVEEAICRLAQLARACGIHLILATQRPSVNVITGLIKANMPSRISFSVTSGVDSRTILDMVGAEKLLGKGDCLYYPQGLNKPMRVQGAFVSDQEVSAVVDFIKETYGQPSYDPAIEERMSKISESANASGGASAAGGDASGRDVYFVDAAKLLMDKDKASIGMLQRYFKVGFNRAARMMDQLEEAGIVGPEEGTKPRQILMNPETFEALLEDGSF